MTKESSQMAENETSDLPLATDQLTNDNPDNAIPSSSSKTPIHKAASSRSLKGIDSSGSVKASKDITSDVIPPVDDAAAMHSDIPPLKSQYDLSSLSLKISATPGSKRGSERNFIPEQEDKFPSVPAADYPSPIKRFLTEKITDIKGLYSPMLDQSVDRNGAMSFLTHSNWPTGFQNEFLNSSEAFAFRFLLIDNSGSMMVGDAHKVFGKGRRSKLLPCTRWVELLDFLHFQARLAAAAKTPTEFRFLRQSQTTIVGLRDDQGHGLQETLSLLGDLPQGTVKLCDQITELVETIKEIEPILREQQKKVVVLLATDGDSSDGDLIEALRPLQSLPVWLVVKLFTADVDVLSFWDNVDRQLLLDIDVISDLVTEAKQVEENNPWLTYGVPMHQLRLVGSQSKEFDLIDECPLTIPQMERLIRLILPEDCFNKSTQSAEENFSDFVDMIDNYQKIHIKPMAPPSPSISQAGTPRNTALLGSLSRQGSTSNSAKIAPTLGIASASNSAKQNNPNHTTTSGKMNAIINNGGSSKNGSRKNSISPLNRMSIVGSQMTPSSLDVDTLTAWDPITLTIRPWIDIPKLATAFSLDRTPKSASCVIS